MRKAKGTKTLFMKLMAILVMVILLISILPLLKVSFYDRATGDDYGYGAVTRQIRIQTHSPAKMIEAAANQVKFYWNGYQGTWFSLFLFAFQPEVFSLNAYWITAWISLTLMISSVSAFLYTVVVTVMGWNKEEFIITDCCTLILMIQFVSSPRSVLFWFNGVVHYILPLALALLSMSCFIMYIKSKKIRYVIFSSIMMTLLGGMSYLSAFMAPLFLLLLWSMTYKKGNYVWKLGIPFVLECIGLVISAAAPGNANRGGSGYSVSIGRAAMAVGSSVIQGTTSIADFFVNKPFVFLIFAVITIISCNAAKNAKTNFEFKKPILVFVWLYLIYCAMYWPGIFAGVEVSGGVPNTIFQVFVLMFTLSVSYLMGYFVNLKLNCNEKLMKIIGAAVIIALCVFTYVRKGTLKNTTDYVTIEYMRSGQAEDYKEQMEEFYKIMTDQSVINAKVHASNNDQGPLMHMPMTDNPENFTNDAAAKFFGKNSVVTIDD